jgi:beta-lactamase superfamily II metal-dependent hydrolase
MKINVLKVFNGDAIHINYQNDERDINILVDSGSEDSYIKEEKEQKPPRKVNIIEGEFKKFLDEMKSTGKIIDLLIITHVDYDHIGGIIKWIESDEFDCQLIKKVWFNSGQLINEYFNTNHENDNRINVRQKKVDTVKTTIEDGVKFEEILEEHNLWDRKIIKAYDSYDEKELGVKFIILSPNEENLKKLLTKWKDEEPESIKTAKKTDYDNTLSELLDKNISYDGSVHNGSSISFILEIENKKLLFLADSFHTTILKTLNKLYENTIDFDLVKLSHHGSKYNISDKLLKKINCKKYIISTDGSIHSHPHKETLAKIINNTPDSELYFNYIDLAKRIFIEQDKKDFNFTVYDTKDLEI